MNELNKSRLTNFIGIFILGSLYGYRKNYINRVVLEYYIFNFKILKFLEDIDIKSDVGNIIALGMEIEDVENWLAPRIPTPELSDILDLLEIDTKKILFTTNIKEAYDIFSVDSEFEIECANIYTFKFLIYIFLIGINRLYTHKIVNLYTLLVLLGSFSSWVDKQLQFSIDKERYFLKRVYDIVLECKNNQKSREYIVNELKSINLSIGDEFIGFDINQLIKNSNWDDLDNSIIRFKRKS